MTKTALDHYRDFQRSLHAQQRTVHALHMLHKAIAHTVDLTECIAPALWYGAWSENDSYVVGQISLVDGMHFQCRLPLDYITQQPWYWESITAKFAHDIAEHVLNTP